MVLSMSEELDTISRMATLIKNGSTGTLTLPKPLNGVLGRGIRVVVLDDPDVVLQYFLGRYL